MNGAAFILYYHGQNAYLYATFIRGFCAICCHNKNQLFLMSNNLITRKQLDDMRALYRAYKDNPAAHSFPKTSLPYHSDFTKDAFVKLVQTTGAEKIRILYGMTEDDVEGLIVHAISVALDANGHEILPPEGDGGLQDGDPVIVDEGQRCPPMCS